MGWDLLGVSALSVPLLCGSLILWVLSCGGQVSNCPSLRRGGWAQGSLQRFTLQLRGWNVPATPTLDEGAEGQGGHSLSPFPTFVDQSWTMSLLFLERKNFGRDNKALSALA